jgi:hypothetical protein
LPLITLLWQAVAVAVRKAAVAEQVDFVAQ